MINLEAEKNVCQAEYDYMTHVNTFIKEPASDKDLIETQMGLKIRNAELIPENHFRFSYRISTRF